MIIINTILIFRILLFYFINYNLLILYYQNLFFLIFLLFLLYNNTLFFSLKIYFILFIDYYSFYLILLTIWIIALILISLIKINFIKLYIYNFIIILIILILTFRSVNYFIFYFFFEVRIIPTLFLIVGWGGQFERIEARIYILIYTLFASLPIIIILLKIYNKINILNIILLRNINLINNIYIYIYLLLAFLVKIPIFFFHLWLPKAHVEAPIRGSIILAGIILKLGGYGLLRIILIIEELCLIYNYFIISFRLIGAVFIRLLCLKQIDIKILVAYSSVVHIGIIISRLIRINYWGYIGGLIIIIGHGLCSSGLFCLVNINYERLLSRRILLNKGIINIIPSIRLFWFILCIFNISSPPSLNLFREIIIINGLLMWRLFLLLILIILRFFRVVYTIYFYRSINHGFIYKNLNKFISIFYREYLLIYLHLISLFYLIIIF